MDTIWKTWPLPLDEGARCHQFRNTTLHIAVERAGEGTVLAAMVQYDTGNNATLPDEGTAAGVVAKTTPGRGKRRKAAQQQVMDSLPPLEDPSWTRAFAGQRSEYALVPAFPAIPVCIHLHEPFSLPSGSDINGWVFSHLEARILISGEPMAAFPLRPPFKTLYGTPDSGVVCRYDEAIFLASEEPATGLSHADRALIAHPVRIRNPSSSTVKVSDLCIYGEQLAIYDFHGQLQSDGLLFTFSSSGVRMGMDSQARAPRAAQILAKARVSSEERAFERSFELFKAMTRM